MGGLSLAMDLSLAKAAGTPTPAIQLSASSIAEGATTGRSVGTASVANAPVEAGTFVYTETGVGTGAALFAINSSTGAITNTAALDYDAGTTSYTYEINADDGAGNSYTQTFTISVTNVLEVTLNALTGTFTLRSDDTAGTVAGALSGKSSGSTLSLTDDAGAKVALSGTNIVAGSANGVDGNSYNFTVRETHADGNNSPRDTTLSLDVADDLTFPQLAAMNASLAANGYAVLGKLGDSTTLGLGGTTPYFDNNADTELDALLTARGFNVSRGTYGFGNRNFDNDPTSMYGSRVVFGAGWNFYALNTPFGATVPGSSNANPITVTHDTAWDTCVLFYRDYGSEISLDRGGAAQTVTPPGSTTDFKKAVFTFPLGTQPLAIKDASGSGFIQPLAVRLYNSTTARLVIIENVGVSGAPSSFATDTGNGCTFYNAVPILGWHAAAVKYGLNDKLYGATYSDLQTNLEAIVTRLQASDAPGIAMPMDVMLEISTSCTAGNASDFDANWKAAVTSTATAKSLRAPLDLNALTTPHSSFTAYFGDNIHPNTLGQTDIIAPAQDTYMNT